MTSTRPATYVALAVGAFALVRLIPSLFALVETEAPLQWWASRSTGFVAYVALWLAMMAGLMISSRGLDGLLNRKLVLELHQQWTLVAMLATLAHVALIVTDAYVDVSWRAAAVPGSSMYMPGPMALGTIAIWGLVLLSLSSWLQRRLSYTLWRVVHASAFGTFLVAIAHGVVAGTDSSSIGAQALYASTAALLACALVFRALYFPAKPSSGKVKSASTGTRSSRSVVS
jgi:sulfoxide reductase heme-binding subunit YedZ